MDDDTPRFGAASDPDLDLPAREKVGVKASPGSPLDELRSEASREVGGKTSTYPTHERPGWSVRYRADVEVSSLNVWRKRCADRSMPDGVDELKLACLILANHCDVLVQNGNDLVDEDGEPVTFGSSAFLESFGVTRAIDAVKKWYVSDGHLMAASQELMFDSGFGDETASEDPTGGSSIS